jgi:hypothetical protein
MIKVAITILILMLSGCVTTTPPWTGFLDTDVPRWQAYLDELIHVDYTDHPLSEILTGPEFPNFNVIIDFGAVPEELPEGADFFEGIPDEPEPFRVTMRVHGVTRREVLWRIARQCDLDMSIGWDENGNPRCVVIKPRKRAEQAPRPVP